MNHIFRPSSSPLGIFFLILHGCDETLKCARMWKILIFMNMMHYGKIELENMEKEVDILINFGYIVAIDRIKSGKAV